MAPEGAGTGDRQSVADQPAQAASGVHGRRAAELLHRRIRGSRLEILDAEGHLPHVSAPELVVAAMRDFVRAG